MRKLAPIYLASACMILTAPSCKKDRGGEDGQQDDDAAAAAEACADLGPTFVEIGYHDFLTSNCGSCHSFGGPGAFADADPELAFEEFEVYGNLIPTYALDPNHKPPFTGPELEGEVTSLEQAWSDAITACEALENEDEDEVNTDDLPAFLLEPTVFLESKTLSYDDSVLTAENPTEELTLTWDLSSEILPPPRGGEAPSFESVEFSMTVYSTLSLEDVVSYVFADPTVKAAGAPLQVSHIEVQINGVDIPQASTFEGLDMRVAPGVSTTWSTADMTFPYEAADGDTVEVAFGRLREISIDDLPDTSEGGGGAVIPSTTFAELTANGGIFDTYCESCHNAGRTDGGLDITSYAGTTVLISGTNPDASLLYQRMVDDGNPMPTNGVLPSALTDIIRQWIIDGAPEN